MADTDRRSRYLRRLSALKAERSAYMKAWRTISDYILPYRGPYLAENSNNQEDILNTKIVDNTATLAHRTLAQGLMSGVTSPARPWFRLGAPDPAMGEDGEVETWLADAEKIMRETFNRSDVYGALTGVYEELAGFGTAAMIVYENLDPGEAIVTCQTLTVGEYLIAQDRKGRVNTLYREYSMTIEQVVDEFGEDAVSHSVRERYQKGHFDDWVEVVHAIEPSRNRDGKRFVEVWFEKSRAGRFLREGGYDEFPVMCPRWTLVGSRVYGRGPSWDSIGDTMQLQVMERRLAQSIDKMSNPPLQAFVNQRGAPINAMPGGVNYVDPVAGGQGGGIRSLYDVNPRTVELQQSMDYVRKRIERALYADLWLIISQIERSNVTATQIEAIRQEKLLMLGPVLERMHHDLLDPLIDRVFAILVRKSIPFWQLGVDGPYLRRPPEALSGQPLKVEYISVLAEAQKSVAVGSIERLMSFVGSLAAVRPEVLDKIDFDQLVDEYREATGAPVKVVVADDKVIDIRKARAAMQAKMQQMQAMQNAAATAQTGAQAAKVLSETDTGGQNALTAMLGAAVG